MKNLRKVVALVLAFAMVLSMSSVSFAADMTAAQKATELGVLKGEGAGVTDEYLAKTPTRLQAVIISLRLRGLEEEALAYEGTEMFSDQDDIAWAGGKAIASYVKANPELGWIGTDGALLPNEPITSQQFVKVMLEALGYQQDVDFAWADVFTFAADMGLMALTADTMMTNDSLAVGMLDALAANTKSGERLVDVLIADGAIDAAKAEMVGLVETSTTATAVTSVKAINLKQLVVTFNGTIDAAGDDDNYVLTADNAEIDADSNFELSEDGTMVTITLTKNALQQDVVDLEIKDILATDVTVEDIEFLDLTIPTVVSAETVGIDTLKVFFSEPMNDMGTTTTGSLTNKAHYSVKDADGDKLYVKSVTAGTNNESALVELYSDLDDDVTITVEKVQDYQAYAVPSTTLAVAVVVDTTAPMVVGYKDADLNEVTLIFDNDIEVSGDLADFYHTNTSNEASEVKVDGNELTIKFTDEMPAGTAYVYIAAEAVNDLWDNDNEKIVVTITVVADVTAPEVVGDVSVENQTTIEVTYNEDIVITGEDFEVTLLMDGDEADETASATIKSADDSDVLVIEFSAPIYSTDGDYSVVIEGMEDEAENKAADITLEFVMEDETAPTGSAFTATIYKVADDKQIIRVNFGETMDTDSITDKALYFVVNATTPAPGVLDTGKYVSLDDDDVTITVVNSGKSIEIEVDDDIANLDLVNNDNLVIGRVVDAGGNKLTQPSVMINLDESGTIAFDKYELVDDETIELTVDGDELTDFDESMIAITTDGASAPALAFSKVKTSLNSDNETVVTIVLAKAYGTDPTVGNLKYTIIGNAGENEYEEMFVSGATAMITDKAAPTVDADTGVDFVSSTSIVITFSEDLKVNTFALGGTNPNGFSVTGGDAEITGVAVSGNVVTLTGTDFTENTNVYYNNSFGITDEQDNEFADFSETDKLQ